MSVIPPFYNERRRDYYVGILSQCPHCGFNCVHRVSHVYRIFKCVEAKCDRCQSIYYISPPKDEFPAVKCDECPERVECLIYGNVMAFRWEEIREVEPLYQFPTAKHPFRR